MAIEAVAPSKTAVTGAIRTAANATGVSFDYLLATAKVESGLNPGLSAGTSSATGLFQFVDQTWLATLKQSGPALGYGRYASAISRAPNGRYQVADPALGRQIMQLRKDPTANAVMAGAFTQQNATQVAQRIGRAPNEGELYIAHFFGSGGGARLINLATSHPNATAAELFPAAARANRSIFYDRQGRARNVGGVYAELTRRYEVARGNASPSTAQAAAAPRPPTAIPAEIASGVLPAVPAAIVRVREPLSFSPAPPTALAFATDPVASANVGPAVSIPPSAAALPVRRTDRVGQAFHSLFNTMERREAVSPVVAQLWGAAVQHTGEKGAPVSAPEPNAQAATRGGSSWDLFRDTPPNARALFDGKA